MSYKSRIIWQAIIAEEVYQAMLPQAILIRALGLDLVTKCLTWHIELTVETNDTAEQQTGYRAIWIRATGPETAHSSLLARIVPTPPASRTNVFLPTGCRLTTTTILVDCF
jgi:hypothetical protein